MSNIFFTMTGLNHYYGNEFLEKEMVVYLKKDKDNEYDKEAISVNLAGLGKIGYVANSPYTVLGESYSAGRLYDKIEDEAQGKIKFILDKGVVCELVE
ncbi:HIRAN domain-containing protein [Holdemanella biformis]|uniref:HIRAN domain-containing protein n=1 Tax=Holdemanella biformis TaxID=1735 RepID=UPI003AB83985